MKARRIEIRGIILDASWDFEWMGEYIRKGMFTPESQVRGQLAEAEAAGEDVDILISSPGGSVVAGGEIINAIRDFPHGKTITVGAYAASMAAEIVIGSGVETRRAHKNSILLFHGAWGVAIGGRGSHEDFAALLGKLNAGIMADLEKFGLPRERIETGFAEGRELTLSAQEALEYQIVGEILGAEASPAPRMAREDEEALLAAGAPEALAACAAALNLAGSETGGNGDGSGDEDGDGDGDKDGDGSGDGDGDGDSEPVEARAGRLAVELSRTRAELRSLQSAKDREIGELKATLAETETNAARHLGELRGEFAAYREAAEGAAGESAERISGLEAELATVREAHAALSGAALLDGGEAAVQSWPDAVARYGLAEAMKRFPALARSFREARRPKGQK